MTEQKTCSISELQQKAHEGDAQAQFDLALCYAKGEEIEKNIALALELVKKAAEQGLDNAKLTLGLSYIWRDIINHPALSDRIEILYLNFLKGKIGYPLYAPYYLAELITTREFSRSADVMVALNFFKELENNVDLQDIGFLYHCAKVLHEDIEKIEHTFTKFKIGSEHNNKEDQYSLANLYFQNIGGMRNDELAFKWCKRAAEQSHIIAQYKLACCYLEDIGVYKNDVYAFEWFKKAAEQNYNKAQYSLACCYLEGIGVNKNDVYAFEWFKKAAEKNHNKAQYSLACCYFDGRGIKKNSEYAFKWLKKAADQNYNEAQY